MAMLSIKIKISDKDYVMKVDESDEENVRLAAKMLNEKLRLFKEQYGIEDKIDLLAMVAFDTSVNYLRQQQEVSSSDRQLTDRLSNMSNLISKSLAD